MRVSDLREKTDVELIAISEELRKEKFAIRSAVSTNGEKKQSSKMCSVRKELARILTIIRERQLQQQLREPLL
jgi:ribosomal protein L29